MKECICDPDVRYGYDERCRVHGHASKSREREIDAMNQANRDEWESTHGKGEEDDE